MWEELVIENLNYVPRLPVYEGGPKNPVFIYKKLHIYSYMFKLQAPLKYCVFD